MQDEVKSELLFLRRALRQKFGSQSFILRWQLRLLAQQDSLAMRRIVETSISRLGG